MSYYASHTPLAVEFFTSTFKMVRRRWHFVAAMMGVAMLSFGFAGFQQVLALSALITSKEALMNRDNTGIILLDRSGNEFYQFYEPKTKEFISLDQIPDSIKHAVIAAEDRGFYSHPGFSVKGIIRAAVLNAQNSRIVTGGSTITQQLVKNTILGPEQTYERKLQEIVLAVELENRYSKDEILEMYLNSVYLGDGAFGVEAAAQTYFTKSVRDLSVAEAAYLVGIMPAPSRYSPLTGDREAALVQQRRVLTAMFDEGYLSEEDRVEAEQATLVFRDAPPTRALSYAAHFAIMVRDELVRRYGEEEVARSGFRVRTSLDLAMQKSAQDIVAAEVAKLAPHQVSNGAAVILDAPTGEIRALVGSRGWDHPGFGTINMATVPRQPGSSFKPLVYATAFEHRVITPGTVLHDRPITYDLKPGEYKPRNYDNRFRGDILPRRALANSVNVPAVEVIDKLSVGKMLEAARAFGITSLTDRNQYGLSLALGAGEVSPVQMAQAYGVLANRGALVPTASILEIHDKYGMRVYKSSPNPKPVLSAESAYITTSILADTAARREVFGRSLTISHPAAVKTGTTSDYRDAWTIGYSPTTVVAVWVGNSDNTAMDRVAGSLGAAPIWRQLMELTFAGASWTDYERPELIRAVQICAGNGLKATSAFAGTYEEYFIAGTEPQGICRSQAEIDAERQAKEEEERRKQEEARLKQEEEQRKQQEAAQSVIISTPHDSEPEPTPSASPSPTETESPPEESPEPTASPTPTRSPRR